MRIRWAWRRISSPSNPGFIVVLILCVLAIVSFALGFAFQPSASTPPEVPNPPVLNLTFQSGSPRYLSVYSFLEQTNEQLTELVVDATGSFSPIQSSIHWTLGITGFTGYLCEKSASAPSLVPLRGFPHDYEINDNSNIPVTSGQPFFVIKLCWDNGAPLITNGSYVSAALPPILAAPGQSGTVTRSLVLSGTSLSSYSIAGGISPTEVTARSWIWTDNLSSSFQSQARAEIPIIASSLPGIQQDNRDIFLSGIFFGIAGGAAVSVVPAALDASDRRKAKDKHKAAAGSPHPRDRTGRATQTKPDKVAGQATRGSGEPRSTVGPRRRNMR
jgi:hypothetical protein